MTWNKRFTGASGLAFASILGLGVSPAAAASTGRSDACPAYACGSATLTFTSRNAVKPLNESIRDTSCNGNLAWVKVRFRYTDGTTEETPGRFAYSNCGAGYRSYNGLYWGPTSKNIAGAWVIIGDGFNPTVAGNYVDNPYS